MNWKDSGGRDIPLPEYSTSQTADCLAGFGKKRMQSLVRNFVYG